MLAYKDIPEELESKLKYYFISIIREFDDIADTNECGDYRSCAGLTYRTCIYHKWFKTSILERLNQGYEMGLVEIREVDDDKKLKDLKRMIKESAGNIIIVEKVRI